MAQPSLPLARPVEPPEPTHGCIRCGRPGVAAGAALCEQCNPLDLAQPSATQVHGIAALGILSFVVLLAVLGRLALSGTGPYTGVVGSVGPADGGLSVTVIVTNQGSKGGSTTCRIVEASRPIGGAGELLQTPIVPAGSSMTFSATVTKFGTTPVALGADCQTP